MLSRRGFSSAVARASNTTRVAAFSRHFATWDDRRAGIAPVEREPSPAYAGGVPRATSGAGRGLTDLGKRSSTAAAASIKGASPQRKQFTFEDYQKHQPTHNASATAASVPPPVQQRRLISSMTPQPLLRSMAPAPRALPIPRALAAPKIPTQGSMVMTPLQVQAAELNRANQLNPLHAQYWMSRGFSAADAQRRAQLAGMGASAVIAGRNAVAAARPWQPRPQQLPNQPRRAASAAAAPMRRANMMGRRSLMPQWRRIFLQNFEPVVATGADIRPGTQKKAPRKFKKAASNAAVKLKKTKAGLLKKQAAAMKGLKHDGNTVASALATVVAKRQKKLLRASMTTSDKKAVRVKHAASKRAIKHAKLAAPKKTAGRKKLNVSKKAAGIAKPKAPKQADINVKRAVSHLAAHRDPAHPAYWLAQGHALPEATEAALRFVSPDRRKKWADLARPPTSTAAKRRRAAYAAAKAKTSESADAQWLLSTIF